MKYFKLQEIDKLYFGHEDIARTLQISLPAAKVIATRYIARGLMVRLKRNMYTLTEKWKNFDKQEKFMLANLIQTPSYISLMTAMDYYQITTQVQQDFYESIVIKRTSEVQVKNTIFNFKKISQSLYFGFEKINNFFIATAEKAVLDAFYLKSIGKYNFDIDSLDIRKLKKRELIELSQPFPVKTKKLLRKYEAI